MGVLWPQLEGIVPDRHVIVLASDIRDQIYTAHFQCRPDSLPGAPPTRGNPIANVS